MRREAHLETLGEATPFAASALANASAEFKMRRERIDGLRNQRNESVRCRPPKSTLNKRSRNDGRNDAKTNVALSGVGVPEILA